MMREAHLARTLKRASPEQPYRGDRMVRRPERADAQETATRPGVPRPNAAGSPPGSSRDSSGRIVGSRRASIVFPAPGDPTISRLWPPPAATSRARRACV